MPDDIEVRLASLAGLVREGELLRRRLAELDGRHRQQAAEVHELRLRHAGEVQDVARLEQLSLARVLVALRGAHAEELSREQAEAEAARYRVAEAEGRQAAVGAERAAVAARLAALADLPARYAAALDAKERHLREAGGPQVTRLLVLAEERGRVEADLRELAEAAGAADVALRALGELRRRLDGVSRQQAADNLLGGALSAGNPHWLDAVAWAGAHADRCLAVLHHELADVGLGRPLGGNPPVVAPTGIATVFFSNMLMRESINRARHNADASAHLVTEVARRVAELTAGARARWDSLSHERHDLLTR